MGDIEWNFTDRNSQIILNKNTVYKIMIVPSNWKLSREYHFEETENGSRQMIFPEVTPPPVESVIENLKNNILKNTFAWSVDALNQSAYEMTYWYMSQVGKNIYSKKELPKEWKDMSPEEAGYNAIKMMLYYIMLRPISERQLRLAAKLYNVYSFGYPLGADSKEMLWPEDFK